VRARARTRARARVCCTCLTLWHACCWAPHEPNTGSAAGGG
jgi:hypothetical protein